ncbi:MAG: lipase family protein [Propionibacteriaceae bacterium]
MPPGSAHGTLLRYQAVGPVPGAHAGATLWRVLYLTQTATGTSVVGSGYVAVPGLAAPAGGYPVIAWAHGSTGMARACAPSLFATSLPGGLHDLVLAPYLATLVDQGYLVTAADYPGLGTPGTLGYYVGAGEGYAVLDAIRAAQGLASWHASDAVVILGHSQGGHAALFAGQLAAGYTKEQRVAGVIAAAPVTSLAGVASAARATSQPVNVDVLLTLVSWSRTYPGLPLDQLLTPSAMAGIGQLTAMCGTAVTDAYIRTPSAAVFTPQAATSPALVALGRANTPGAVPTAAAMLIVQGSADDEVSASGTTSFVTHVCAVQPDRLTYTLYHGATHDGVLTEARSQILGWIAARFAGQPGPTGCG